MRPARNRFPPADIALGKTVLFGLVSLGCGWNLSYAGDLALGFGYLGQYTDNLEHVPVAPAREWINAGAFGIGYRENTGDLLVNLQAQAQYQTYKYAEYPNETLYFANAAAVWNIVPRFLSLTAIDRYDQIALDVTAPDTVSNRTNINVFSAGPDFTFRLSQVNYLTLGGRYGNVTYGDGSHDMDRYGGFLRWSYLYSSEQTYSINYQYDQARYRDDVLNDNFRRQDLFFRIDWHQFLTQFLLDAGVTSIYQDRGPGDSGPTLRLTLHQRLNQESRLGLILARDFLDPGLALLATATAPGVPATTPPPIQLSSEGVGDFYYATHAETYYRYESSVSRFDLRAFYRDIDYQDTAHDRQENGFRISLSAASGWTTVPGVFYNLTNVSYQEFNRDDQIREAGVRIFYPSTRNLGITAEYRNRRQSSTDPLLEYSENIVTLAVIYSTNPAIPTVTPRLR